MPKTSLAQRLFKTFTLLALLGVLGLLVLLASLRVEHTKAITLPAPTGPFAVGRVTYAWNDATPDLLAPIAGAKRELVVWIWYPAETGPSPAAFDDYLPGPWRAALDRDRGALNSKFLTRDLSHVHGHSLRNAAVSPRQPSYPVVILRGGASSEVSNYQTLAEDLASHGYIVVGIDAPYRTNVVAFPDGRVIHRTPENNPERCLEMGPAKQAACIDKLLAAWTSDIAFVLDRLGQLNSAGSSGKFTGRLDMARVGIFGHSFGGAQAAQFCREDPRCKAGIDLDGAPFGSVIRDGLRQPFLFVLSEQAHSPDAEGRQVLANIQSIYDRLPPDGRLRMVIRGANHFLFSDDGALLKSHIVMRGLRMAGVVGIDGRRQLTVAAYCVRSFFDAILKNPGGAKPSLVSPLYPEIEVLQ